MVAGHQKCSKFSACKEQGNQHEVRIAFFEHEMLKLPSWLVCPHSYCHLQKNYFKYSFYPRTIPLLSNINFTDNLNNFSVAVMNISCDSLLTPSCGLSAKLQGVGHTMQIHTDNRYLG